MASFRDFIIKIKVPLTVGLVVLAIFTVSQFNLKDSKPGLLKSPVIYSGDVIDNDNETSADGDVAGVGGAKIVVEISGAVSSPGVYVLPDSSRLFELIMQAGGYSPVVSYKYISRTLNTTKKLKDEEKVYIPYYWDVEDWHSMAQISFPDEGPAAHNSAPGSVVTEEAGGTKVNINTCTKESLTEIKGIGDSYSDKIVANRPYSSIEELYEKTKLPKNVISTLSDVVVF